MTHQPVDNDVVHVVAKVVVVVASVVFVVLVVTFVEPFEQPLLKVNEVTHKNTEFIATGNNIFINVTDVLMMGRDVEEVMREEVHAPGQFIV